MSDNKIMWQPAWKLRESIAAGELLPSQLMDACLAQIETVNPTINALITLDPNRARRMAKAADEAVQSGKPLGPLHGIPFLVKDDIWTTDIPTTGGCLIFKDFIPPRNNPAVSRLEAAGAIMIGKTNLPEFATWPRTLTKLVGETRNPWDTTRTVGASSGGSGAALAAGMVPLGLGTDGGGSIRIPSALNGCTGIHPSPRRVPSTSRFSFSIYSSIGPMARDVRDMALAMQIIGGPDPSDPECDPQPMSDVMSGLEDGVKGLRIAWSPDLGYATLEPGIADTVRSALNDLEGVGAIVDEPGISLTAPWEYFPIATAGSGMYGTSEKPFTMLESTQAIIAEHFDDLCEYTKASIGMHRPSLEEWKTANKKVDDLKAYILGLLETYDVIVTPTMTCIAPPIPDGWGFQYNDEYMGTAMTSFVNLTQCAAASYPVGLINGMPVGLQIVGKPFDEAMVLRVCRALEKVRPWTHRPPLS